MLKAFHGDKISIFFTPGLSINCVFCLFWRQNWGKRLYISSVDLGSTQERTFGQWVDGCWVIKRVTKKEQECSKLVGAMHTVQTLDCGWFALLIIFQHLLQTPCHLVWVSAPRHTYWCEPLLLRIPLSEMPLPPLDCPNPTYSSGSSSSSWVWSKLSLTTAAHVTLPLLDFSIDWDLVRIIWVEESWFLQSQRRVLLSERDGKERGKGHWNSNCGSCPLCWQPATPTTWQLSTLLRACHMRPSDPHLHSLGLLLGRERLESTHWYLSNTFSKLLQTIKVASGTRQFNVGLEHSQSLLTQWRVTMWKMLSHIRFHFILRTIP